MEVHMLPKFAVFALCFALYWIIDRVLPNNRGFAGRNNVYKAFTWLIPCMAYILHIIECPNCPAWIFDILLCILMLVMGILFLVVGLSTLFNRK
jgi:hypothetical protein